MAGSARAMPFLKSRVVPNLIPSLKLPKAQILWIGCSDSGFVETKTLDLLPEEIIVHRNPGNVFSNDDLSTSSTLEYSLRILKVCLLLSFTLEKHTVKDIWLSNVLLYVLGETYYCLRSLRVPLGRCTHEY